MLPQGSIGLSNSSIEPALPGRLQQAHLLDLTGHYDQARATCEESLKEHPEDFESLRLLGCIELHAAQPERAVDCLNQALAVRTDDARAYRDRARALKTLRQLDASLADCQRGVALDPASVEGHVLHGAVLQDMERWSEATAGFDAALAHDPTCSEALLYRAQVLMRQHRYEEALADFERMIELNAALAEAHVGRANALGQLARWGEAISGYNCAIAVKADYAEAFLGRARAMEHLEGLDAALPNYERVFKLKPDWDPAHMQRGFGLLALGRLEEGFSDYEWRAAARDDGVGAHARPRWTSRAEPIAGKRILLRAEQGLGDTIHFCRYATLVANLGAEVILSVPAPLKALLSGLKGVARVVAFNDELPEFDTHCKLMSLPFILGTSLATVPGDVPYLHAPSTSIERWRNELGPHNRTRVGLAWSGNPRYPNDHNRSMKLAELLAHLPSGPQYFILQKTIRDSDRDALGSRKDLVDMSALLEDFSVTAGLCECMDLVLSVDTSVAHLAGALGKRTWILLPRYAEWRWMLDRTDSPWYPTATLFRAPRKGDWSEPLGRVHQGLAGLSSHR